MEKYVPLAEKLRPESLDNFYGQQHIVGQNTLLRRAIKLGSLGNCIFYGPPGTGKTTLARIVCKMAEGNFKMLNAVTSGVGDAKAIIEEARKAKTLFSKQTYLMLDECHRWNKAQSDCILSAMEDGSIIFIGSTTENPYYSMTRAIVSRCKIFEFLPLGIEDIKQAINFAINDKVNGFGDMPIDMQEDALNHIAHSSGGDLRSAFNSLELAVKTTDLSMGKISVTKQIAEESTQKKALSIDETMYYDMLSCFCKSLRGSDADAALYYSQRLIASGIDPLIIARRLVVHASEDVGMADSNALLLATSALTALKDIGVPEGLIPLSHAIIYVCEAEKSNSVINAMQSASNDARENYDACVPLHLLNHKNNFNKNVKYKYPHDFGGYVYQQYLPDKLKNKIYYVPSKNGREKNLVRKKIFK